MTGASILDHERILEPGILQVRARTDEVSLAEMAHHFVTREFTCETSYVLPASIPPDLLVPSGFSLVREKRTSSYVYALYEVTGLAMLSISSSDSQTHVTIAGRSDTEVASAWNETRRRAGGELENGRLRVSFWSSTSHGFGRREQLHERQGWQEVSPNYPRQTRRALDELMTMTDPSPATGRLVLWHGPAGTGKTTAATALMTEWSQWCDTHVVTDPEQFFSSPDYLMQLTSLDGHDRLDGPMPTLHESLPPRWKLVVCEDADEYLRSDARQRSGPALGRLLNLTDGLMGRHSNTLVLLTTNDDVGRLHPAVTRPGRCLAAVEFPLLTPLEARDWCHGQVELPARPISLAELYALGDGRPISSDRTREGLYL